MAFGRLFKFDERLFGQARRMLSESKNVPGNNRRKNAFVFCGLLTSVIGIYVYSMYSVRMDKIDFDK